jgi:hypothetical protein
MTNLAEKTKSKTWKWRGVLHCSLCYVEMAEGFGVLRPETWKWPKVF